MPNVTMAGFGTSLGSNGTFSVLPDVTLSPQSHPTISPWLLNGAEAEIDASNQTNVNATKECTQIEIPNEVYLMLGGVSLVENLLVVIVVIKNRNLHSPMYYFICSLAVSDILLSLSKAWEALTILLVKHNKDLFTEAVLLKLDYVYDSLICISFLASIFNLAAITTDRYVTIFHALRYHNIMTGKRVAFAIAGIWVFCTSTGIIMITFNKSHGIVGFFVISFLLTLVLIVSLYIYMFLLAQMHAKQIRILPGHTVHQRVNFKGALTLTVLLGVFIACWAPLSLHFTLYLFCPSDPYCTCFISLFQIDLIFIMCHSVIDPLIYAFRDPKLSSTFKKMPCCLKRQWYVHASGRFLNA
ncbi:melanocortin receptor 5-like isoform X2 [Pristis pectinata]|uniref:melanocortin receptor 5-like isoform X2 n=1 Tax=Pristis pectinata TaxID=685728 RepID=UPI00223CEADF|nr:melanocortin receptor 5-like isoform X2 [Pristis pectinata]